MMAIYKRNWASWHLFICFTLCGFGASQMYYENEPCDFGTYKGTCLGVSKCSELPDIMKEIGLKAADVGHCGFTITEEMICCPTRQAPTPTATELPNAFKDLLKPFEFRPTAEDETTTRSIQTLPVGDWFSNNFKETNKNSSVASMGNDDNAERINSIFNINPVSINNTINDDTKRINDIFNLSTNLNENSNENNTNGIRVLGENIHYENTQKINAIFNTTPIGNNTQMINSIFSRKATNITAGNANEDEARKINAIFNVNTVVSENTNERINTIFNNVPNGNIISDNDGRIDAIFNVKNSQITNSNDSSINTQKLNDIFNLNPVPIGNAFVVDSTINIDGNNLSDGKAKERISDIFGGIPNAENSQRINEIFNGNSAANENTISVNNQILNNANLANVDFTQRINEIFKTDSFSDIGQSISSQINDYTQKLNDILNENAAKFEHHNDPFYNYMKQPRYSENDKILTIPVQQPPLLWQNQFWRRS